MGGSHDGRIEELTRRLDDALDHGADEEIKDVLAEIGDAELRAKAPKNRIRAARTGGDFAQGGRA